MRIRPSNHGLIVSLLSWALLSCALLIAGCTKSSPGGVTQQAPNPLPPAGEVAPPAAAELPATEPPATAPAGDAGAKADPAGPLADCDQSKIRCRRMPPQCPEGQVASVSGSCFGECVAVERCACSASIACPQPEKHACWYNQHCGPYVR